MLFTLDTSYMEKDFLAFKNREIKAKSIFEILEIDKNTAYNFVKKYHYLGNAKFFCVQAFGLYYKKLNKLVGVATYSLPQGIVSLNGWFGLGNDTKDIYELSRLCLLPSLNGTNATSFLLGNSIRELKKQGFVRAIITLACSTRHVGSIYQVCNFKYYGLSDSKTDFYRIDGIVNPRGKTTDSRGVWLPRDRKHRYAYIIDNSLVCNYSEMKKPTLESLDKSICCGGTQEVFDKRFGDWFSCPICCGELKLLRSENI